MTAADIDFMGNTSIRGPELNKFNYNTQKSTYFFNLTFEINIEKIRNLLNWQNTYL